MSSLSLVRIVAISRSATDTTTASTTSAFLAMPNSRPASCASFSPRGTTTHPFKKRRSCGCWGERLTWATTGAGTNGTTRSSKRVLCSSVDSTDDTPHWRREHVSFRAAYGNERVIAHLYLPKNAAPPYLVVIYYPSIGALGARNSEFATLVLTEDIVKSGRALILPAYKGMLDRGPTPLTTPVHQMRDLWIDVVKDLRRTVDYLESRSDIDIGRVGYLGFSLGGIQARMNLVLEPRIRTAVLLSACTVEKAPAEVDSWNYAPRVKTPVLMLNGRYDSLCPVESTQNPFFQALGTPEKDKRHVLYEGGHTDYISRMEVVKEGLDWLDHYLGPVH